MSEELTDKQKAAQWFCSQVRKAMLDFEELNELIDSVEISDLEIKDAAARAIDRFNSIDPPTVNRTIWDFPSKDLLMEGTISRLLMSGAILHHRNNLPYNAGGISVQTHNNGPAYERLSAQLDSNFEQKADIMKRSENIQSMLGVANGISSQYGLLGWYHCSNW